VPDRATNENRWVEAYLTYLATKTLPVDPTREERRKVLQQQIENEAQLHRKVVLIAQLQALDDPQVTAKELERRFLDYGATFGTRNNITYRAWRAMGVPPRVLKEMRLVEQRAPRDPEQPKQMRYKQTKEHAERVFSLWKEGGHERIQEELHLAPHYITTNLRDLSGRFPDVAKKYGYNHAAEVAKSLANNAEQMRAKLAVRKAS
jgi:hypothetical protein